MKREEDLEFTQKERRIFQCVAFLDCWVRLFGWLESVSFSCKGKNYSLFEYRHFDMLRWSTRALPMVGVSSNGTLQKPSSFNLTNALLISI